MIEAFLAHAAPSLRKPRGVHIVASLSPGVVQYEIWDRMGVFRFEGKMRVEDFDDSTLALAEMWLNERDPEPEPARPPLCLHRARLPVGSPV
jgi:hypothetical protein